MVKADKRLQNFYDRANRLYFDGGLPNDTIVSLNDEIKEKHGLTVGISDDDTKHTFFMIYIHPDMHVTRQQVQMTLLHEMCHVKLYPYMKHGKRFDDEMIRLAVRGAFRDLW